MDSQYESELREELAYLEKKKANYGWTQKDADRYNYIKKLLKED